LFKRKQSLLQKRETQKMKKKLSTQRRLCFHCACPPLRVCALWQKTDESMRAWCGQKHVDLWGGARWKFRRARHFKSCALTGFSNTETLETHTQFFFIFYTQKNSTSSRQRADEELKRPHDESRSSARVAYKARQTAVARRFGTSFPRCGRVSDIGHELGAQHQAHPRANGRQQARACGEGQIQRRAGDGDIGRAARRLCAQRREVRQCQ
jgi:hypothetical protein